jgi:hypothetical protein
LNEGLIYFIESAAGKGTRINYSPKAIEIMNDWISNHLAYPYPNEEERIELCEATGLSRKQLRVWFINTRKVNIDTQFLLFQSRS